MRQLVYREEEALRQVADYYDFYIDVDSCKNVEIHHSTFMTGDDAICVKAGKDREARKLKKSSEDIYIHDCTVMHSPSGFVIGSEMSRGVRNVLVEDIPEFRNVLIEFS